jgi:hypothetical protein
MVLVYFTDTPFTETYDYSGLYEASHIVDYKNIFPSREASLCHNPCTKKALLEETIINTDLIS